MPNTPSLVQEGVTVYSKGRNCTPKDGLLAEKIFEAVGPACYEVPESLIDASTGISGSGPAYMYIIIGRYLKPLNFSNLTRSRKIVHQIQMYTDQISNFLSLK